MAFCLTGTLDISSFLTLGMALRHRYVFIPILKVIPGSADLTCSRSHSYEVAEPVLDSESSDVHPILLPLPDNHSFKTKCLETQQALMPKKDLRIS